ncbi:hypothetical protein WR25_11534 [Diploscapter pachys]|uniref:Uncharacterized protein n=1 Tax=Diploscapter pachys TaxID=2018661 RepID=A0A2A2KA15_9BILA|nr:hypothetical protein WR25_11534 [Diploscapter pachys]
MTAQRVDLASGALGRIGGDAFDDGEAVLDRPQFGAQLRVFLAEQFDALGRLLVLLRIDRLAPGAVERIAVLDPQPGGDDPAGHRHHHDERGQRKHTLDDGIDFGGHDVFPFASAVAERFDLAGGALGGIGGDAFEDGDPFLQAADLAGQLVILLSQQADGAFGVGRTPVAALVAAAPAIGFIAVANADPVVDDPACRPDREDRDRYEYPQVTHGRIPSFSSRGKGSAEAVDFLGQPAVAAGVVQFHVGEPAVDIAQLAAHLGGRPLRVGAHALPEFGVFVALVQVDRLLGRQPRGGDIAQQDPAGGGDGQDDHGDADQGDVEAGVVGDPRTDAGHLAVRLVEVELGAGGHLSSSGRADNGLAERSGSA